MCWDDILFLHQSRISVYGQNGSWNNVECELHYQTYVWLQIMVHFDDHTFPLPSDDTLSEDSWNVLL